jgi:large subunit ribosomal protein L13
MLQNITKQDLNKTVWVKPQYLKENRKWYVIDATGMTLGKLAVKVANLLTGKNKPHVCDFWDCGDYVIVENAQKIKVTGNKLQDKLYRFHSGYKGHLKEIPLSRMLEKNPEKVIMLAVKGMLPKNKLRKERLKRLKLFKGEMKGYEHLSPERI